MKYCPQHKRYKAKKKPQTGCIECWTEWCEQHPDETIQAKDLILILKTIMSLWANKSEKGHNHLKFDGDC